MVALVLLLRDGRPHPHDGGCSGCGEGDFQSCPETLRRVKASGQGDLAGQDFGEEIPRDVKIRLRQPEVAGQDDASGERMDDAFRQEGRQGVHAEDHLVDAVLEGGVQRCSDQSPHAVGHVCRFPAGVLKVGSWDKNQLLEGLPHPWPGEGLAHAERADDEHLFDP